MHDYFPFAVTIAVILVGILFSRQDIRGVESRLRQDIQGVESRLGSRLDRIEADLREFYRTLGQHDARIDNLEKGRTK